MISTSFHVSVYITQRKSSVDITFWRYDCVWTKIDGRKILGPQFEGTSQQTTAVFSVNSKSFSP